MLLNCKLLKAYCKCSFNLFYDCAVQQFQLYTTGIKYKSCYILSLKLNCRLYKMTNELVEDCISGLIPPQEK